MFYVIAYVLMTVGAFGIIMILSREGFEAENLSDYKGLNQRNPWLALIMMFLMLSMAGIPPMIGFYAKLSVLQAIVNTGFIWLAITAVVLSLIGAFYYLRIIKLMYFEAPEHNAPVLPSFDAKILISINGLAVLITGIFPQALMGLSLQAIQTSM